MALSAEFSVNISAKAYDKVIQYSIRAIGMCPAPV